MRQHSARLMVTANTDVDGNWNFRVPVPDWVNQIVMSSVDPKGPVGVPGAAPSTYHAAVWNSWPQLVTDPVDGVYVEYRGGSDLPSLYVDMQVEILLEGPSSMSSIPGFVDMNPPLYSA